jgi:hypothetical protein
VILPTTILKKPIQKGLADTTGDANRINIDGNFTCVLVAAPIAVGGK